MGTSSYGLGELFETVFLKTCRLNGIAITRIPDSCKQLSFNRIIRVKSPFDWILTYNGQSALIDTKTVQGDCFRHSDITEHQVMDLSNHECFGAIAGYIIWLRKTHKVFFMPSLVLVKCMETRGSFDETHVSAIFLGDERFDVKRIFKGVRNAS